MFPKVSMNLVTGPGAASRMRPATPSPYSTGMTPWLDSHWWLAGLASPMTVAEVRLASWLTIEPTPPAAPDTTTVSPGVSDAARTPA